MRIRIMFVPNFFKEMDLVFLEEERCGYGMDWGIAPAFVIESAGRVKVIKEGRVSFPVAAAEC